MRLTKILISLMSVLLLRSLPVFGIDLGGEDRSQIAVEEARRSLRAIDLEEINEANLLSADLKNALKQNVDDLSDWLDSSNATKFLQDLKGRELRDSELKRQIIEQALLDRFSKNLGKLSEKQNLQVFELSEFLAADANEKTLKQKIQRTLGKEGWGSNSLRSRIAKAKREALEYVYQFDDDRFKKLHPDYLHEDARAILVRSKAEFTKVLENLDFEVLEDKALYWVDSKGQPARVAAAPDLQANTPRIFIDPVMFNDVQSDPTNAFLRTAWYFVKAPNGKYYDNTFATEIEEMRSALIYSSKKYPWEPPIWVEGMPTPKPFTRVHPPLYSKAPELKPKVLQGVRISGEVSAMQAEDAIYVCKVGQVREGAKPRVGSIQEWCRPKGYPNELIELQSGFYELIFSNTRAFINLKEGEKLEIPLLKLNIEQVPSGFDGAQAFVDYTHPFSQEVALIDLYLAGENYECNNPNRIRENDIEDYCDAYQSGSYSKLKGPVLKFDSQANSLRRNPSYETRMMIEGLRQMYSELRDKAGQPLEEKAKKKRELKTPQKYENRGREYIRGKDILLRAGDFVSVLPGVYGIEFVRKTTPPEVKLEFGKKMGEWTLPFTPESSTNVLEIKDTKK